MISSREFIGLDLGHKRTGIARASAQAGLAEPLMTVETPKVLKVLRKKSDEVGVEGLVVGLPRNLKGDETSQTTWVRQWVDQAKKQINLPFYWQDEALTSRLAEARKRVDAKKDIDIDAVAAAFILQDFLDTPPAERVVC